MIALMGDRGRREGGCAVQGLVSSGGRDTDVGISWPASGVQASERAVVLVGAGVRAWTAAVGGLE